MTALGWSLTSSVVMNNLLPLPWLRPRLTLPPLLPAL